ncbi:unnamed protein product [Moneuplotes crassus]|uniref:Copine C-terminal domain-containing protein n=1 Tax=Euplotes crassus TaxID=5936 RepID=A0AAD1Y9F8_EUPCR|nr:unnamed protein product [Moneuplotes crassus]
MVCVDFTASNGDIRRPSSFCFLNSTVRYIDYQNMIKLVGNILEVYRYNCPQYPCYGFGGIPKYVDKRKVSHCFHLNGEIEPEVDGVERILDAYQLSFLNCEIYGHTNFESCMIKTVDCIKDRMNKKMYHILLILTNGDIHDMPKTRDIIVERSHYPLSIIIIGFGENSFHKMIELNGDYIILCNTKVEATIRDIVQFVKFNEFRHGNIQALAEEVLEEVLNKLYLN